MSYMRLVDLGSELDGAPQKLKGYIIGRGVTLQNVSSLHVLEGDRLQAVLVLIWDQGSSWMIVGNHYTCAEQRLVTKPDNDPLPVALRTSSLTTDLG